MKLFLLLSLFCLSLGQAFGLEVPALSGPVVDQAGLFSSQERQTLSNLAVELRDKGGPHFQTLTVHSLEQTPIEDYSIQVAEAWKLGEKKQGNGVILIIAVEDRKMRIEVGQGIEGEITDAESSRYINEILKPAFKQNQFFEGTALVMVKVGEKFGVSLTGKEQYRQRSRNKGLGSNLLLIIMIILFVIFSRFGGLGSGMSRGGFGGYSGGGFGGRSSGGGSSWGGGGGGFSGGGSSGSW